MMAEKPDISAFFPAYNEESSIASLLGAADEVMRRVANRYELIVVLYDGSTDNTKNIVEGIMKSNSAVRLVIQPKDRKGYGVALRLGINNSRYDYIFYTDADNQCDVRGIEKLLPLMDGADIASAYRQNRNDQLMRRVAARVYNALVNVMFLANIKDIDCPLKIYRKGIFNDIKVECDTGMADAEILMKAMKHGYRIAQVGIDHAERKGGSSAFQGRGLLGSIGVPKVSVMLNLIKDLIALRMMI